MLADIEHFPSVLERVSPEAILSIAVERLK